MIKHVVWHCLLVWFCMVGATLFAQDVEGVWRTIDDQTEKPKSHVRLDIVDNKLFGYIEKVVPGPGEHADPLCEACEGDLHGKRVIGMRIINGLSMNQSGEWEGENGILDPESGKVYTCKIWLASENQLMVRGYVGFFYRTQQWERME